MTRVIFYKYPEGIPTETSTIVWRYGKETVSLHESVNIMDNKMEITQKHTICVLDGHALNPGDLSWDGIAALGDFTLYDRTDPQEVISRAKDADILLINKINMTADVINQLPNLKYIGEQATGFNNIDLKTAKERGIIVTNIPAYSTDSVAQLVFAHILNITNRVGHYAREVREGEWTHSKDFCYWDTTLTELKGKKLGVVGLGHTGSAVARIAEGFGMEVYAYTSKNFLQLPHNIHKVDLDELFTTCDVISLHCPLTTDTQDLVNATRLKTMKRTAILINTSRGPVVNEHDLAEALNNGVIAAFGGDVLSTEPAKADNPLLTAKNCYITPHTAWGTLEARTRLMTILKENIEAYLSGKPKNVVNK